MWASVEMHTGQATAYGEATAEDIQMAASCSFSVEFETMSGGVKRSDSSTGAQMQFKVCGHWTNIMWILHSVVDPAAGATSGQAVSKRFAMNERPTKMSIEAGGSDALQ